MKKIVVLLIAAYFGIFAFQVYQRVQYDQKRSDQKWQYFKKVIFGKDIDILPTNPNDSILRWEKDIKVKIDGHPSAEDIKTINESVSQLGTLIAPKKIEFTEYDGDIRITFLENSEMLMFTRSWPKNAFSRTSLGGIIVFKDGVFDKTEIVKAGQTIRTDSTTQFQRNNYILRGLAKMILGIGKSPKKLTFKQEGGFGPDGDFASAGVLNFDNILTKYSYFDVSGNDLTQLYSNFYKNSIFNSFCSNCTELTDIDEYIIQTYYSPELNKMIEDHNETSYFENYTTLKYILFALCSAIILSFYFFGFFGRTLFPFVDDQIKNNWLAFNFKTLSILLITIAIYILSLFLLYYLTFPTQTEYSHPEFQFFLFSKKAVLPILIGFIVILVNGIYLIEKIVIKRFEQFAIQQLFSFVFFATGIVFSAYLLNRLSFVHDNILLFSFYVGILLSLARFLFNYSYYQRRLLQIDKEQEIKDLRELKTRAELNALQSKINPHFLYNALNSIAGLAHEDADKVEQMAMSLSKLFRYSINKKETDFDTVQNEVEMVAIYLEIEKVRFGDRLQYNIDVADDVLDENIPMFIIQPLVENAIKHGISNITVKAILNLAIVRSQNKLLIKVGDNGPEFPEDLITGFGLQGIYEKLDILYLNRYEIKIQNGHDKNISILLG